MRGRHRPGKHSEQGVKAKEFYKITPVKPVKGKPADPPTTPVKGSKLTPSDTDRA